MKCLILAAGQGSRLSARGPSKPLVRLLGVPLVERTIRLLMDAGVREFVVVSGHRADQLRRFLDQLSARLGISLTHVENPDWRRGNGLSVLAARDLFQPGERFLLVMADHLFDPSIVRDLASRPPGDGQLTLAVDRNLANRLVDLDDVTRVRITGTKLSQIGKRLEPFDGFDTGLFCSTPALFSAIQQSIAQQGDDSLSGGVRRLATAGRANVLDIGGRFWLDIDSPQAMDQAEQVLLRQFRGKLRDGPVSRHLNRLLSGRISRRLADYPVTPNQISLFSFCCCLLAAGLFAGSGYLGRGLAAYLLLALGGLLTQFASVIDGCDGEIARLKFMASDFGAWLDAVLDRYADALLLLGATWRVLVAGDPLLDLLASPGTRSHQAAALGVGLLAIVGTLMLSYTADKYDHLMRQRFASGRGFRIGRDLRMFVLMLGALCSQMFLALLWHAVLMNLEVVRRVWVCRKPC